jgi:isochorismate synthase
VSRAASATAPMPPQRLVVAVEPAPEACDALALLRGCPSDTRFYWEEAARGVAIAGVGAATTLTAAGTDRFARLGAALAACPLPAGALAVGGFAFADQRDRSGPWRDFAPAELVVPEIALVRRQGRGVLVAAAVGATGERLLPDLLARARSALARPAASTEPPTAYRLVGSPASRWRQAVEDTLGDIAAGRLGKLVLARAASVHAVAPFDPVRVVARLRHAYGSCSVFAVGRGVSTFVGATPERLARVRGNRLETAAVAGSAARGATARSDRALARGLLASPKERAEHGVVVDDVCERLRPMCHDVVVPPGPRVLATEAIQHLHTPIRARLRAGRGLLDAVAALHPTPAVCGVPRAAALATVRARDRLDRGWYAGGVGWLDADGGEMAVALRTALLRGPHALLHAGAGIVAGSTWEPELEETRLKLRPLLAALLEV